MNQSRDEEQRLYEEELVSHSHEYFEVKKCEVHSYDLETFGAMHENSERFLHHLVEEHRPIEAYALLPCTHTGIEESHAHCRQSMRR